jgi:hypothetical protein
MTKKIATLWMVVITASLATAAFASDTDRLANCVAVADQAKAAAESRDAGVPRTRTVAIIDEDQADRDRAPVKSTEQVNTTVSDVYGDRTLTPDQASARAFQNCFEAE